MNVATSSKDDAAEKPAVTEAKQSKPEKQKPKGRRFTFRWGDWFGGGRGVALLLLLVMLVLRVYDPAPIELMRLKTFDIYQNIKPRTAPDSHHRYRREEPVRDRPVPLGAHDGRQTGRFAS